MSTRERVRRTKATAVISAAMLIAASCVSAQSASAASSAESAELVAHPWVVAPPSWSPEAYFTNLKDGALVEAPFVARFGLSLRGIVPAGQTAGRNGHHHLLINQPLPLDFRKPLPFTDQYIHFGKGQMEALVDLPPGRYTLRLVLADQGHIPYFVYSKPLEITVVRQNKGVAAEKLLGVPRVEILNVENGAAMRPPFRIQMHASGFNVSHAAPSVSGTGHFRLTLERSGQKPEVLELDGGQTEVWVNPPRGDYVARLELIGNAPPQKAMATGLPVVFSVR
ncbi:MAG: DUF4399 domain-containing protein [Gammaproteobacteria bacterium]|nr:DUF4399 domain-containing protein [Gammaproteobacteria bacterium]MBU1442679.1 DUF4399 domain-containing protein [Gammaproteobacteria bacterium]MBU2285915.1 DUF4399 domain-containing protein [Gammaproteobacteria bacterium]MBU2409202.1 DUF4399 domain-containing protein [Gammaproteobacteria bacterium]